MSCVTFVQIAFIVLMWYQFPTWNRINEHMRWIKNTCSENTFEYDFRLGERLTFLIRCSAVVHEMKYWWIIRNGWVPLAALKAIRCWQPFRLILAHYPDDIRRFHLENCQIFMQLQPVLNQQRLCALTCKIKLLRAVVSFTSVSDSSPSARELWRFVYVFGGLCLNHNFGNLSFTHSF